MTMGTVFSITTPIVACVRAQQVGKPIAARIYPAAHYQPRGRGGAID